MRWGEALREDMKINTPNFNEVGRNSFHLQAPKQRVDEPTKTKPKLSLFAYMKHIFLA